jgi:LCP family protein required for cell wall assembly
VSRGAATWQRAGKVGRWVAIALAALLVVALVVVLVVTRSLERVQVGGLTSPGDAEAEEDDAFEMPDGLDRTLHVLLLGSDDRSVLTAEEQRELHTGYAEGARTETIALMRLDPVADRVDVLRFPRDLVVERCDGSQGRINAAYGIGEGDGRGGATCVVETISRWSGIPIHHVVEVDFRGFVDLVDAVDGVTLDLAEPLEDERAGLDLPAGCVDLDGAQALAFVRARSIDSDFGRIDRQQQLLAAALEQIATPRTLADPRRLTSLVRVAQNSLTFDDQLDTRRLLQLAQLGAELGGEDLVSRTIVGVDQVSGGASVLLPDEDQAAELFQAFLAGELPDTPDPFAPEADDATGQVGTADADDRTSDGTGGDDPTGDAGDADDAAEDAGPEELDAPGPATSDTIDPSGC